MAELRSNEVLAKIKTPGQVLCLLNKICPQEVALSRTILHPITSYVTYDGATSSYYHAYSGYVYRNNEEIDSSALVGSIYQGSGWTFTGGIDSYNRIYLSGKGPTTTAGAGSVSGKVQVLYTAADFKEYTISCHIPKLNSYMCSLVRCVCGDFILTNSNVLLDDFSTITLSTEDKSYSIDMRLDYSNQTIDFYENSQYDQSSTNYQKMNNKYFKTHPISLYLYTVPVYYM